MKKIRILQCFGGGLTSGGIETLFVTLQPLMPDDIHFDYLTVRSGDEFYGQHIRELGSVHYACGVARNANAWCKLYKRTIYTVRLFLKEKYDIIHISDTPVSGLFIALLARLCKNKTVVLHSHTDLTNQKTSYSYKVSRLLKVFMPQITHCYMACSRQAAISAFPMKYVDSTFILKNGVDTEKLKFNSVKRECIRKDLHLDDSFIIGSVARLTFQKNQRFVIELMPMLKKTIPTAKLLLVGGGEDLQMLKDLVQSLDLADNVIFYGESTDIPSMLCAMDIFVFPSVFEGFGMAALEAQVSGLHVVATDTLPHELDVSGIVHWKSLNDPEGWIREITKIYNIGSRANIMNEIVRKGYDIKSSANELAQYYRQLAGLLQ